MYKGHACMHKILSPTNPKLVTESIIDRKFGGSDKYGGLALKSATIKVVCDLCSINSSFCELPNNSLPNFLALYVVSY